MLYDARSLGSDRMTRTEQDDGQITEATIGCTQKFKGVRFSGLPWDTQNLVQALYKDPAVDSNFLTPTLPSLGFVYLELD